MKSPFLFFTFIFLYTTVFSQNFLEANPQPDFIDVENSAIAFADVDSDGDDDVLITGLSNMGVQTKLYTNDGGNYTEDTSVPFPDVTLAALAFADVDDDGDQDVLITGRLIDGEVIARLYLNDGAGVFAVASGTPFEGVRNGTVSFIDIDGDNDLDVLITGRTAVALPSAKLYTNDGGVFTEVSGTPFEGVLSSSVAIGDVDGDDDQDILITGLGMGDYVAKLYTNDGGTFSEDGGTPFTGVNEGAAALVDVDADGDVDALITGENGSGVPIAKLYTNDGGTFTEVNGTALEGVWRSSMAVADVDGNNSPDVLITGENEFGDLISKLYTNNNGVFTELMGTPFAGVWIGSAAFSDIDSDGDMDLLITGEEDSSEPSSTLYINNLFSSVNNDILPVEINLLVYPNPVSSRQLRATFDVEKSDVVTFRIYSEHGALYQNISESLPSGEQTYVLDVDDLPAGNYLLHLENGQRKRTAKFTVN